MTRSAARTPVRNGILAALLATEYKRILPRLKHIMLKRGETIYRADQDRPALQKKSCECYGFIRREYERLQGAVPRLLSRE